MMKTVNNLLLTAYLKKVAISKKREAVKRAASLL